MITHYPTHTQKLTKRRGISDPHTYTVGVKYVML